MRVPGALWPYHIKGDYKITASMTPLGKFELLFTDDAVSAVYFLLVESSGPLAAAGAMAARGAMAATGAGGVFLRVAKAQIITTPATYRVTKAQLAEDSCEDLGLTHLEASDLDEGDPAVDTGAVSSDLSGNTTGSDPDSSTGSEASSTPHRHSHRRQATATGGKPPTGDTVPATGGKPDKLYDNGYFYIKGHKRDLKMHIHDRWLVDPPVGIGRSQGMSKTCTPSTVGEERATPVRSLLYLKAWMLWRARIHPGWIQSDGDGSRQRLFTEEADLLLAEVTRLQPQEDGLLGNVFASKWMREWVPDIVANI